MEPEYRALNSYTERSPSGKGFHILVLGAVPPGGYRSGSVEMYDEQSPRYFTFTGHHVPETPFGIETRDLADLHRRMLAGEFGENKTNVVGNRKRAAGKGDSASERDWSLYPEVVELVGRDPDAIEHEMRKGSFKEYYRPKWDWPSGGQTWLRADIERWLQKHPQPDGEVRKIRPAPLKLPEAKPASNEGPDWELLIDSIERTEHIVGVNKNVAGWDIVNYETMFGDRQIISRAFEEIACKFEWQAKRVGVDLKFVIENPEQWEAFRGFYSEHGPHAVGVAVKKFLEANLEGYKRLANQLTPVGGFIQNSTKYLEAAKREEEYNDLWQTFGDEYHPNRLCITLDKFLREIEERKLKEEI